MVLKMATTIVILLVLFIIIASFFRKSNKQRYRNRGFSRGYDRNGYNELRQQREQERTIRYLERQQKREDRYAKRQGQSLNFGHKKSQFSQTNKRRFK